MKTRKMLAWCAVALVSMASPATWSKSELQFADDATKAYVMKVGNDLKNGRITEVTALQLGKDYAANEVAADATYRGKRLLVTGKVDAVSKDILDNVVVQVRSANTFMPVHARFARSVNIVQGLEVDRPKSVSMKPDNTPVSAAAPLKKGQSIGLLCTGAGAVLGSPQIKDCELLSI